MAFTGTSLLSLPIITTGTESGAWGNITNNGLTQYLDTSIAGALSITSSITLANTSGDASGTNLASTTAQYRTLVVPASGPSANIVITAPSSNRTYHVVNRNATYTVQIRAGANSGVTLGVNQSATVTYNSTSADYELVGVVGASTATDNAVARFDGTTGEIIQNSGVTIDDSGNLLLGTTTAVGTITVQMSTQNSYAISGANNYSGASGAYVYTSSLGTGSASNTNCWHFRGVTENVNVYYLYGNGTSSFTSDQRLKKNIETTRDGYLDDLMQLRVVKYQWESNPDDSPKELGLIAQEVETIFPGLVQEADETFKNGIKPKVLKVSVLPFMLLKAIQEQQALINELRARVAALESQP